MNRFIKILRIILVLFFFVWAVIWFSIRAYKLTENKKKAPVFINTLITTLYETPYQIKRYFRDSFQAVKFDPDDSFLRIGEPMESIGMSDSVYMLYSKYVNPSKAQVFLQNLRTGEVHYSWDIPLEEILKDLDSISLDLKNKAKEGLGPKNLEGLIVNNTNAILIRHPLFLKDSSLIFKLQYLGHIYKFDKNSKLVWKSKRLAHHSIELDENGDIWTCSIDLNNETANKLQFREDALLSLDQNGNEKYFKSLTDVYQENNLFKTLIEATPVETVDKVVDPYHLNDVQPVCSDGTCWKKGDLFLSMRHKSILALFRPSTGKIVWIQQGPWYKQHDVNIENDSIISIFNNNASFINNEINSSSNISFYNFKSNNVSFYADGFFKTGSEGRQTSLANGDFIVESTNEGIYYLLDSRYSLKGKFYAPYVSDLKMAQYPGWSRYYLKEGNRFIEQ